MSKISELKAKYKKIKSTVDEYKTKANDIASISGNKISNIKDIPKVLKDTPKAIWDQTIGKLGSNPKETGSSITTIVKNIGGTILNIPKTALNIVKGVGSTLKGLGSTLKSIGSSLFGKKKRKKGEASDQTITTEATQSEFLESAASEVPDTFALRGEEAFADRINPNNSSEEVTEDGVAVEKVQVNGNGSSVNLPVGTKPVVSASITDKPTAKNAQGASSTSEGISLNFYDKKNSCYYPGRSPLGHEEKDRLPACIVVTMDGIDLFIENFFLESIQYNRAERMSLLPLLNGDNIVYFYGSNPTTVTISGICLDMLNHQWLYDLEWYYENMLRGTVSSYGKVSVSIRYDNKWLTGYMTSFGSGKQSSSLNMANFQISLIMTKEKYASDYITPDNRGALLSDISDQTVERNPRSQAIESIMTRIKNNIGSRTIDFNAENKYYNVAKTTLVEASIDKKETEEQKGPKVIYDFEQSN